MGRVGAEGVVYEMMPYDGVLMLPSREQWPESPGCGSQNGVAHVLVAAIISIMELSQSSNTSFGTVDYAEMIKTHRLF